MKHRNFDDKKEVVYLWMDVCNLHWERLLGDFNNDELWWNDLFHSMNQQDWEDVVDVAKGILAVYPEEVRRFPNFPYQLEKVEKRLHKMEPVIKQWNRQGYNSPATGLFMSVRDALNEINGTPTKRWTEKEREKILKEREDTNQFENLFEVRI